MSKKPIFQDGQTYRSEEVKAWLVAECELTPLSSRWHKVLNDKDTIEHKGHTYFFKTVDTKNILVHLVETEHLAAAHQEFLGSELGKRTRRHLAFQNLIFLLLAVLAFAFTAHSFLTSPGDGSFLLGVGFLLLMYKGYKSFW